MRKVYSNPGSPIREIRKPVCKSDGSIVVEVVGKENFQDYINSFKDCCDVQAIVARAVNGEPDLLQARAGAFGDFVNVPRTMAEVCQKIIDGQALFESLKPEVRALFSNDVYKFIASADEPDFLVKCGFVKEDIKESESVES